MNKIIFKLILVASSSVFASEPQDGIVKVDRLDKRPSRLQGISPIIVKPGAPVPLCRESSYTVISLSDADTETPPASPSAVTPKPGDRSPSMRGPSPASADVPLAQSIAQMVLTSPPGPLVRQLSVRQLTPPSSPLVPAASVANNADSGRNSPPIPPAPAHLVLRRLPSYLDGQPLPDIGGETSSDDEELTSPPPVDPGRSIFFPEGQQPQPADNDARMMASVALSQPLKKVNPRSSCWDGIFKVCSSRPKEGKK